MLEYYTLEASVENEFTVPTTPTGSDIKAESPLFDDKAVLKLAKQRLAAKRSLISQLVDYFLIVLFMFLIVFTYDDWIRFIFASIFCTLWGIRLLVRIVRFVKPSFKNGIAAYFKERSERQLEAEYNRLKKTVGNTGR